jgi:hypothetical protein
METVRIRDPGWKKVGSGIRDKHLGSATLVRTRIRIQEIHINADPDQEHCIDASILKLMYYGTGT